MKVKVVVIEDAPLQQLVAQKMLNDICDVAVPSTPKDLSDLPDGADIVFVDIHMGDDWQQAKKDYLLRNPQAEVIEWTALGIPSPRRIIKTGIGDELVNFLRKRGN